MPGRARRRYTTFLVAPSSGSRKSGATVYAAKVPSAAEALAAVASVAGREVTLTIVGSLSTRTAKALNLKPGEVRPV